MSVENLVVKLQADVKNYVKNMEKAEKQNEKTGGSSKALATRVAAVGAAAAPAAVAVAALTVGSSALALAFGAVVRDTALAVRELDILAKQSKLTTEEFKAITFATNSMGVSAEQFSDISKDLSDKLGEFGKVGTGAFQDFADVVGLSTSQAKDLAIEMESLSSPQVLGMMVSMLEDANASSNEMIFVMESMGSELSRLIPLFSDQSSALNQMVSNYEKVNETLALTTQEAKNLQEAGIAFDLLSASMQNAKDKISAQVSPVITGFINDLIEQVPRATQAVSELLEYFGLGESTLGTPQAEQVAQPQGQESSIDKQAEIDQKKADMQAEVLDRHLNHNAMLLESDMAYYDATIAAYEEMREKGIISEEEFNKEYARLTSEREKAYQEEVKEDKKKQDAKDNNLDQGVKIGKMLNAELFEDNKAIAAGLIVADTASAIMKSLSINPYDYGNVAVLAVTGALQLANALSSQKGGGSTSGAAGGGATITNRPEDFQRETTGLDVTSVLENESSSVQRVVFDVDGNEEFISALSDTIAKRQRAS